MVSQYPHPRSWRHLGALRLPCAVLASRRRARPSLFFECSFVPFHGKLLVSFGPVPLVTKLPGTAETRSRCVPARYARSDVQRCRHGGPARFRPSAAWMRGSQLGGLTSRTCSSASQRRGCRAQASCGRPSPPSTPSRMAATCSSSSLAHHDVPRHDWALRPVRAAAWLARARPARCHQLMELCSTASGVLLHRAHVTLVPRPGPARVRQQAPRHG